MESVLLTDPIPKESEFGKALRMFQLHRSADTESTDFIQTPSTVYRSCPPNFPSFSSFYVSSAPSSAMSVIGSVKLSSS